MNYEFRYQKQNEDSKNFYLYNHNMYMSTKELQRRYEEMVDVVSDNIDCIDKYNTFMDEIDIVWKLLKDDVIQWGERKGEQRMLYIELNLVLDHYVQEYFKIDCR